MQNLEEQRKLVLLSKIAARLDKNQLSHLAAETLTEEDISELRKLASLPDQSFMQGLTGAQKPTEALMAGGKDIWQTVKDVLTHAGGGDGLTPEVVRRVRGPESVLSSSHLGGTGARIGEGLGALGSAAARNPGTTAALAASPFVLKWLYDRLTGPDTAAHEQKLSSAGFTPQIRADLEKIAHDPEVALAIVILGRRGLLGA